MSQKGKGATFTVQLPFVSAKALTKERTTLSKEHLENYSNVIKIKGITAENQERAKAGSTDHPFAESKILVVDDEPVNRIVLDGYLKLRFNNITERCNGQEALDLVSNGEHFDLILLDVMMPGLSGYETCIEIRKNHNLQELPIVFLTAKTQAEDLKKGYEAGANDYLTKPIIKEELLMKVEAYLKSRALYYSAIANAKAAPSSPITRLDKP